MITDKPLPWRELLFEAFAEAERRGFGTVSPQFTANPGRENDAADFLKHRLDFLADKRLDGDQ